MKPSQYWIDAAKIGHRVFDERSVQNVDEQAGPAYFQGMALSRWLFWKRLKLAIQSVSHLHGTVAIDFGCGFGLALPQLRETFETVIGVDLMPELATNFLRKWDSEVAGSPNRQISIVTSLDQTKLTPGSVDLILALDVLEHFESLSEVLAQFHNLLSPSGVLVVSGPTENMLYRLGRKLVGFSGAYHHQNIYQVIDAMRELFDVRVTHRFPLPIPLFLICCANNNTNRQRVAASPG